VPRSVPRRIHGLRHPEELRVSGVAPEGLDAEAAVGAHHRRIIHCEIYPDVRLVALAEAAVDEVRRLPLIPRRRLPA
jgi:hypothetical protein